MKRNKEGCSLVFWLSFTVMHVEILSVRSSWNWFEAQKLCEENNDRLPNPRTYGGREHLYWSSQYKRYSFWIKILGCYNDTGPGDTENVHMYIPSAGFCQEICAARNTSIFGIKQTECKCFGKFSLEQFVSPDVCTTPQPTNKIKFGEHGSANAFTLYESDFNVKKRNEIYCVAVQCHGKKQFFFKPLTCSPSYRAVCQNSVSERYQNWTSSMELCKTGNSSYLVGNVSLDDVNETCGRLNVTETGELWLGVARELYTGYDLGVPVNKEERKSFLECALCDYQDCNRFVDCEGTVVNTVYCEKGFNISTSDSVTATVQPGRTQSDISTQTSEPITATNEPGITQPDSSNTLSIVLPLVIAIIIIGGLVIAAVIYIRRKRGLENHNAKPLDSRDTENGYTDIDIDVKNKNYFVLEQQSETTYKESHVNYTYDSNPYTDTAEGVYDHLRDKESRKSREDEGNLMDSNPYKDISEGIYDHLKDKELGKINKSDGKVMENNPYKEMEGGVYDHLREKETGKFTEENNYDHTPATAGKEYCAHGGINEQSTDTDYDHAMSFFDYKQHNQVIEEANGGYAKTVNIS